VTIRDNKNINLDPEVSVLLEKRISEKSEDDLPFQRD
jgi:hypothetical protein